MKVIVIAVLLIGSIMLGPQSVQAGSASGTVIQILPLNNGVVFFSLSGSNYTNQPACSQYSRFAVNTNLDGGRSLFATVMAAYLTGNAITAEGTGTCDIWGDTESAYLVAL